MRVMVLGLRSFPGVQGGIETHAERLYPRLRDLGCELEVVVRSPYWSEQARQAAPGIRFRPLWSPRHSGAEALVHSLLGVLYAGLRRPDVLHIHAIGPALFTPLARLLGLRVVVTHHGPDYDREKWGRFAKWVLRTGERLGMRYAHARIVISGVIADAVRDGYGCDSVCIPNGVDPPADAGGETILQELGLTPGRYVLNVSRLVPEKRHLDLIEGFREASMPGWKLVLVGAADGGDPYTQRVVEAGERDEAVVVAGYRSGSALGALYANAGLFALPSTHEGLPIALLEALSYGLPSVVSDIAANREVGLPPDRYFRTGDVAELAACLRETVTQVREPGYREQLQAWVRRKYDWNRVAGNTLEVYQALQSRTS